MNNRKLYKGGGGVGISNQNPSMGNVWILTGTHNYNNNLRGKEKVVFCHIPILQGCLLPYKWQSLNNFGGHLVI